MAENETLTTVRRIIAANREIAEGAVSRDSRLLEDLDIDSLAATEIVFDIEDAFGIMVPEQRALVFTTVGELCDAVDELVNGS